MPCHRLAFCFVPCRCFPTLRLPSYCDLTFLMCLPCLSSRPIIVVSTLPPYLMLLLLWSIRRCSLASSFGLAYLDYASDVVCYSSSISLWLRNRSLSLSSPLESPCHCCVSAVRVLRPLHVLRLVIAISASLRFAYLSPWHPLLFDTLRPSARPYRRCPGSQLRLSALVSSCCCRWCVGLLVCFFAFMSP
jgi:hypothetical protein